MEDTIGGYLTGVLNVKFLRPIPVKQVTLGAKIVEKGEKNKSIMRSLHL